MLIMSGNREEEEPDDYHLPLTLKSSKVNNASPGKDGASVSNNGYNDSSTASNLTVSVASTPAIAVPPAEYVKTNGV